MKAYTISHLGQSPDWPFGEHLTRELIKAGKLRAKKTGTNRRNAVIITDEACRECIENLPDYPFKDHAA